MGTKAVIAASLLALVLFISACNRSVKEEPSNPNYRMNEQMVAMRDGVHLQTLIVTPVKQSEPLPILLFRSPYGVPKKISDPLSPSLREWDKDGCVFVFQNLRGRF